MRLRHSIIAQDDQSEVLASAFIHASPAEAPSANPSSNREIDEFVTEFRKSRKIYHKRVMWGERWASGQVRWIDD